MGAGKTTVVGPLLALLASSNNDRLVTLCCPAPLLEFSRGYVVVHVYLAYLAVECTNTAFLCLSCLAPVKRIRWAQQLTAEQGSLLA